MSFYTWSTIVKFWWLTTCLTNIKALQLVRACNSNIMDCCCSGVSDVLKCYFCRDLLLLPPIPFGTGSTNPLILFGIYCFELFLLFYYWIWSIEKALWMKYMCRITDWPLPTLQQTHNPKVWHIVKKSCWLYTDHKHQQRNQCQY